MTKAAYLVLYLLHKEKQRVKAREMKESVNLVRCSLTGAVSDFSALLAVLAKQATFGLTRSEQRWLCCFEETLQFLHTGWDMNIGFTHPSSKLGALTFLWAQALSTLETLVSILCEVDLSTARLGSVLLSASVLPAPLLFFFAGAKTAGKAAAAASSSLV